MTQRVTRRYGLPWGGYQSSVDPHLAPPDKATSDGPSSSRRSQNWRFNPLEGVFYRREGTAIVGNTTGVLENGTGEINSAGRCRKLISLRSPSLADGYPTRCTLWNQEADPDGCIHFYSTNDNGGTPHGDTTLNDEFDAVTYPTGEDGGIPTQRIWPILRTSDDSMSRLHTVARRAEACPGARGMLEIADWLFLPNFHGTPWRWNKTFNDDNADTNVLRIHHTGRPSPLGMPDITSGTTRSDGSWHDADIFYISVAFRFEDGSVSMPIIPRDRNADINYDPGLGNMTGYGKVQISSGGTTRYENITWSKIPIGPSDCVGRYLLRTPKNSEGADEDPAPLDLRITAYIPNNVETTYTDPNGNDLSLVADPLLVRFDHIMQPPARYLGTCDQRIVAGYAQPNPVAIYLAPHGATSGSPTLNINDGDAVLDNDIYTYALTGGTLTLRRTAGGLTASTAIANLGDNTLQSLVDKINNLTGSETTAGDITVTASGGVPTGGKWVAALAPGADGSALVDDVGTAADNDNLVSITGAVDFTGDGNDVVRGWCVAWPAVIFFSTTYLSRFPTAKRRVFFTMGGPGMPANAANSWAAGNFRDAPESYGDLMGIAPLSNGCVVCFSKGIMTLQNRKSGISGEDIDYRLWDLNQTRGCISPWSIVSFNNAVGYMTLDGYVITDGREEVLISGDIWKSQGQTGEWAYELGQSAAGAAADTDLSLMHANVMGSKLTITYRLTSGDTGAKRRIEYDFSGSSQFSGLRGVLQPSGQPWGWSTPLVAPVGFTAMGEVLNASGINRYAVEDGRSQGPMTTTGRIFQIETGEDDNGTDFTSDRWTARDFVDALRKKRPVRIQTIYKKNGTGLTMTGYRDGLGTTTSMSATIPTTGSNNYKKLAIRVPQTMRAAADQVEWKLSDNGSGSDAPQDWGMEVEYDVLDSHT